MKVFTKTICSCALSAIAFCAYAEDIKLTLNVEESGSLPTLINAEQKKTVTDLTLTGKLNGTDIKFLREMAGVDSEGAPVTGNSLRNLDMSEANIVAGGVPYFQNVTTTDDIISEFFFNSCSQLKSLKIPVSAKGIKWQAFSNCTGLSEFVIPDNVEYVDEAFDGCTGIENIDFGKGLKYIYDYAFNGCTALKKAVLPESLEKIGIFAFSECSSLESVNIPQKVKTVGSFAFSKNSSLKDITFSNNLEKIESDAFSDCTSLQKIVIPNSVTEMEEGAFEGCTALTDVTLSENLKEISDDLFSGCESLQHITLPENMTRVGEQAFCYDENLLEIKIPNAVTEIGDNAFFNCERMKTVEIGSGLETLGEKVFIFCEALESINVSEENENYKSDNGVLMNAEKTSILFMPALNCEEYVTPDFVTDIADGAMMTNTRLRKITISDNVKNIGEKAFFKCDALEYVVIGSNVESIGEDAFFMDENIKEIHSRTAVPVEIDKYTFWDTDTETCVLYVPKGCVDAYKEAEGWKEFKNIKEEETSSICNTETKDRLITINGKNIAVNGTIKIYSANGKKVYEGNDSTVDIHEKGVFLIVSGNNIQKVAL